MGGEPGKSPADLTGKTVIVSGGGRGIGAGVCRLLVERGAWVIIGDLADGDGPGLSRILGETARFEPLDVSREDDWRRVVDAAVSRFGQVDALINCAGILISDELVAFDRAVFDRVIEVNLIGTALGIKYAGRAMQAGGGSIVNISSTEGLQGANSMAAYASSKWGVRGLTKVAALELGQYGIRVNSVHPGPINTPMVNPRGRPPEELTHLSMLSRMAIPRVADVSEVAELCAYLIGDGSRFVTGAEVAIDGGLTAGNFIPVRPGAPAHAGGSA